MYKRILLAAFSLLLINFASAQKTATQYYDDGIKLQDDEKYTEALAAFKNAIVKNPNYKEALYSAGWTCNELKKYAEALPFLQKAKTLWSGEAKVYLELGYASEMLDKKADAIENYNKCLSLKDDYALAYKYLGILYYDDYDYKNCLLNLRKFIEYEPDTKDDDVYYRKAVSENELEQYDDALVSIDQANYLDPNNVKFINERGYTYLLLKNTDEALKNYNKAVSIDPKSLTGLNGIADVYRKLKKETTEAIRLYAKTLAINSKNIKANYWTGWCYNELDKPTEAIPYLKKVIEVDDKYVSAYTELGYCEYSLKNYDDALTYFKKAFTIEKTELNLYYTGLCFIGKKDKASATKMMNDLKAQDSEYADKLKTLIDKM
ncbi:MAG: tetratricopeptide repeat protein [Ferruginibacter sp.]